MNIQNIKTAASESSERWVERPEIRGVSPALAENLMSLRALSEGRMLTRDRDEQRFRTLTLMSGHEVGSARGYFRGAALRPPR